MSTGISLAPWWAFSLSAAKAVGYRAQGGGRCTASLLSREPSGLPPVALPADDAAPVLCQVPQAKASVPGGAAWTVLCVAATEPGARAQREACVATGNQALFLDTDAARAWAGTLPAATAEKPAVRAVDVIAAGGMMPCCSKATAMRCVNSIWRWLRGRPIVGVQGLSSDDIAAGGPTAPNACCENIDQYQHHRGGRQRQSDEIG